MADFCQKTNLTVEGMRRDLENISSECRAQAKASSGEEARLLEEIAVCAGTAREKLLDMAVAMTRYVTYCLEQEENFRVDD